jgi:hypothetical protein
VSDARTNDGQGSASERFPGQKCSSDEPFVHAHLSFSLFGIVRGRVALGVLDLLSVFATAGSHLVVVASGTPSQNSIDHLSKY